MIRFISILFFFFLMACYSTPKVSGQFTPEEFDQMANEMARGNTNDIDLEDFIRIKKRVVVLDSREKKEYDISHIPGAIWVGYEDFTTERLKNIDKEAEIVVYCSVGYRSERIGEKIQKAGYKKVHNLNGSIFRWVNEGYKLEDAHGNKTTKIHGYNKDWAKWLKKGDVVF